MLAPLFPNLLASLKHPGFSGSGNNGTSTNVTDSADLVTVDSEVVGPGLEISFVLAVFVLITWVSENS